MPSPNQAWYPPRMKTQTHISVPSLPKTYLSFLCQPSLFCLLLTLIRFTYGSFYHQRFRARAWPASSVMVMPDFLDAQSGLVPDPVSLIPDFQGDLAFLESLALSLEFVCFAQNLVKDSVANIRRCFRGSVLHRPCNL